MTVQPEALLSFAAVAQLGSLSAAAQQRHLSQPALSVQLKHLSAAVGEPLLVRHRLGMHLTPAGQALLPYALELSRVMTGVRAFVSDYQGLHTGSLRIAASNTLAAYLLPTPLRQFHEQYPGLQLSVRSGNSEEALAAMTSGAADLALIERPLDRAPTGTQLKAVGNDRLRLVLSATHPLALPKLTRAQLSSLSLIQREAGSGTREVSEQAMRAGQVSPPTLLELAGNEAVKEAVLSGLGGAFLSEYCVRRELSSGLLISPEVPLQQLKRDFWAVFPLTPSLATVTFLEIYARVALAL